MAIVYVLLGSNIGNRLQYLQDAVEALGKELGEILMRSSIYETEPWGVKDQSGYLNQALCVETSKSPEETLVITQGIELKHGRFSKGDWQARTLDIDLLFYDDRVISLPQLCIPHPLLQDRRFVLVPLVEIAPSHTHPQSGKSMSRLLEECSDTSRVVKTV